MKSKSAKKAASKTFNKLQQSAKQAAPEKQRSLAASAPAAAKQAKGKGKANDTVKQPRAVYNPYRDGESVLFVGEANFSFAKSWAARYPNSAKLSIATSYDSEDDASKKYSDLQENVDALREMGVTVLFDTDAQKLEKNKQLKNRTKINAMRFDKIAFNFPHVGVGEKDESRNVRLNQILLLRFLKSARAFLKEEDAVLAGLKRKHPSQGSTGAGKRRKIDDEEEEELPSDPETDAEEEAASSGYGTVLITLFTCKPYNLWSLPALAKNGPQLGSELLPFPENRDAVDTQPKYIVERSFAFEKAEWPGYDHRRTIGHKSGNESLLDREHAGARTWELRVAADA